MENPPSGDAQSSGRTDEDLPVHILLLPLAVFPLPHRISHALPCSLHQVRVWWCDSNVMQLRMHAAPSGSAPVRAAVPSHAQPSLRPTVKALAARAAVPRASSLNGAGGAATVAAPDPETQACSTHTRAMSSNATYGLSTALTCTSACCSCVRVNLRTSLSWMRPTSDVAGLKAGMHLLLATRWTSSRMQDLHTEC